MYKKEVNKREWLQYALLIYKSEISSSGMLYFGFFFSDKPAFIGTYFTTASNKPKYFKNMVN